jgi:hypothetical protein
MSKPLGIYAYPWDLLDEGTDQVLDQVHQRAGLNAIYLTTWYHSGMFFLPHNPKRKSYFPQPGALYYTPGSWHGRHPICPPVSDLTPDWPRFWDEVRGACDARGMQLTAWMPVLHNSGAGQRHPEYAVHNAWGDPIIYNLCASHEAVRDLVVLVVGDLVDAEIYDRILLESIEYLPLRHGYHHEVIGVPLDAGHEFLLSLCFCTACQKRAKGAGIDAERLRQWVVTTCQKALEQPTHMETLGWTELKESCDGELGRYLELRKTALTQTLTAVRERAKNQSDLKLAILDFGPLYPLGPDGRAWQSGVDLAQQLPLVDEVHPTFYFTDSDLLHRKIAEYAAVLRDEKPQIPAVRAILPQTTGASCLREQVEATAPHAQGHTFYNYSFMSLETLDWIRGALG